MARGGGGLKSGKLALYLTLFASTFAIGAFTFGGGYVILPMMKKRFVDRLRWLEEGEMLDLMSIAQSSPGAIAVKVAAQVGYRLSGVPGALTAIFGTVLPPLILLTLISMGYEAFRASAAVALALRGLRAGVAALIADVVIGFLCKFGQGRDYLSLAVAAAAFALTAALHVNVMLILLGCGLAGVALELVRRRREEGRRPDDLP